MKTTWKNAALLSSALLLSACGSDSDSSSDPTGKSPDETSYTSAGPLDGSTDYAYYDLDSGTQLQLTAEEAKTNTVWDIAVYSTNVIINGGHSGPGDVTAYFTGNNADFYDDAGNAVKDKFINATPASELDDFIAVTAAQIPKQDSGEIDSSKFKTDEFKTVFSNFYLYNHVNPEVSANADQTWLAQSATGFSKVRISDLTTSNYVLSTITFAVAFKGNDDQAFSAENAVEVNLLSCTGDVYFKLDTATAVTADDAWDIRVPCATVGADTGGEFSLLLAPDSTAYALKDGDDVDAIMTAPGYYLTGDFAETVFKHLNKWYQYGLDGGHNIWSQYGVYMVNTGTEIYKLQITSYYDVNDDTVTSRQYSFIYEALVSE